MLNFKKSIFLRNLGKRVLSWCPGVWEYFKKRQIKERLLADARQKFAELDQLNPGASLEDYVDALNKHLVSFREYYYSFKFWNKTEEERSKFISREATHMLQFRVRLAFPDYDNPAIFWHKERFLAECSRLGLNKRKWLYSEGATREQVSEILHEVDCIVKQHDSSYGDGIYKVHKDNESEVERAIEDCLNSKNVIEECVFGCRELQEFHPQSLNTLRVVTISYGDKSIVFRAGLRMGRGGAVVDNTKFGGLYANINVQTGVIDGEALDYTGATHSVHPDSGKRITGFHIPYWPEIVEQCNKAAIAIKGVVIIGWDVCVMDGGRVEFIEANHGPDFSADKEALLNALYSVTGKHF